MKENINLPVEEPTQRNKLNFIMPIMKVLIREKRDNPFLYSL
jgi:hypothetical protein